MYELPASNLHRVMNGCDGSVTVFHGRISSPPPSDTTREGLAAHSAFRRLLEEPTLNPSDLIGTSVFISADGSTYVVTADMIDNIYPHVESIRSRGNPVQAEKVTDWVITNGGITNGRINGRADVVSSSLDTLYIDDLKYGWKPIDPAGNWTLISHAIAESLLATYDWFVFTIHQPRPYHPDGPIRSFKISRAALLDLRAEIHRKFSRLTDTLTTSPTNCYKCAAASICPALRLASMSALDIISEGFDDSLSAEELSYELDLMNRATEIIKVRKNALDELAQAKISSGKHLINYEMTPTLGNRKWKPEITAEIIQALTGVDVSDRGMISPAAAERAGISKDVVNLFCDRPSGFKLARVDLQKSAARIFKP